MKFEMVDIGLIYPFDGTHFAEKELWDQDDYDFHQEGIVYIKGVLKTEPVLPIAVRLSENLPFGKYERLDGFKRFMAMKESGYRKIPCFIYDESDGDIVTPGMQHGMSLYYRLKEAK